MGGPQRCPADLLRLIEHEIAILANLRDQAPAEVDELLRGIAFWLISVGLGSID